MYILQNQHCMMIQTQGEPRQNLTIYEKKYINIVGASWKWKKFERAGICIKLDNDYIPTCLISHMYTRHTPHCNVLIHYNDVYCLLL